MRVDATDTGLTELRSFLEDLENAVTVATTLVHDGHRIDLEDFDSQVGLLCAKALDLPDDQGRLLRTDLMRLREKLEVLEICLKGGP